MAQLSVASSTTQPSASEPKEELTYLETVLGYDPFKKRQHEVKAGLGKGGQVQEKYVSSTLQGRFGIECGGSWEDDCRLRW